MRIGIDVSKIGDKDGIGRYTYHLVKALMELDAVNEYTLFNLFHRPSVDDPSAVLGKLPPNVAFSSDKVPSVDGLDLFHGTAYKVPSNFLNKLVFTVHDLTFVTHPEFHALQNRIHCVMGTVSAVCQAATFIAVSNHTKRDMVTQLVVPENRVNVVHLAADEHFSPTQHGGREHVAAKYGIRSRYIFNLGTIEPRKNLKRLIQAYAMLPTARKEECSLVIGGGAGWLNSDIYRYVQDNNLGQYVKMIGNVDDEDLPALYGSCEVFVYPSVYEGFGLPVLEAMACGAPVITSRTSSLPEVAGDGAILVDPEDVQSIRDAMEDLLTNGGKRSELREKGLKHSMSFSWRRTAKETLGVYERTAKAPESMKRTFRT